MIECDKGEGKRLLVGYTSDRARKDAYNRDKGVRRLEKAYRRGSLTKEHINKRGYNKFLSMEGDVKVTIDYDKLESDAKWDGLKGYLTNTDIPASDVYAAYHNLWHVERAFRISKSNIEIRPMFHFTRRRIEAHVCICFVALKVSKGTGTTDETGRHQYECRQSAGTCSDHRDNTTDFAAKQANHLQNNAHETTSTYRPII